jgi:hypothetical protein
MKKHRFDLEKMFRDSMNDELVYAEFLEKEKFDLYLDGLFIKLAKLKTEDAETQIEIIERMKRFLKRQQYILTNHIYQSKLIQELNLQNQILELKNEDLKKEINKLKQLL